MCIAIIPIFISEKGRAGRLYNALGGIENGLYLRCLEVQVQKY